VKIPENVEVKFEVRLQRNMPYFRWAPRLLI